MIKISHAASTSLFIIFQGVVSLAESLGKASRMQSTLPMIISEICAENIPHGERAVGS